MTDLVDSLLELSKAGWQELRTGPIDMRRLAETVLGELLDDEERTKTDVVLHPLPPATGNESLVRQVFTNLLSNALKVSSKNARRRIEIGARSVDGETAFFVRDDGAGFEPGSSGRLFHVFERLHHSRDFDGTGIGLALVRRIVERHGGTVGAEGAPGAGATFWFSLRGRAG